MNLKAKKVLNEIHKTDVEINRLIEEKRSYQELAEKATQSFANAPTGSKINDKIAELSAKIVDIENEICEKIDELIDKKYDISKQIKEIKDRELRSVLTLRHVRSMQFPEIAEKMGYSQRTIFRMHNRALEELEKILSDSDKK